MILNTGSRTDIPAFYSEWFMNRVREGYVMVRNPYNPKMITRYDIDPDITDIIVFCTKNPEPMLKDLDGLKDYRMYWNVTITPYGKDIEENVPDKKKVMDSFIELSKKIGKEKVVWRYDPIFLKEPYTLDYHLMIFEKMAAYLEGYCDYVIVSFIDLYEKTKRNFPDIKEVSYADQCTITENFVKIADAHHMKIRLCHEKEDLKRYGADVTGCLSKEVLEEAFDMKLKVRNGNPARQGCACLLGNDIGAYNSCMHYCRYCYANYDKNIVKKNLALHDPSSPLLIGKIEEGDIIKTHQDVSIIDERISLF